MATAGSQDDSGREEVASFGETWNVVRRSSFWVLGYLHHGAGPIKLRRTCFQQIHTNLEPLSI